MVARDERSSGTIQTDVTVDIVSDKLSDNLEDEASARRIALVRGSGPEITGEIRQHLQCRLRLAALVMFFGFGVFLVRNLFWPGDERISLAFLVMHGLVTACLGACGFSLCRRQSSISLTVLRFEEALIFGLPASFLLVTQYWDVTECARHGFLPSHVGNWLLLMFTYAFLIPNQWQRASWVIGAMALAPIVLTAWLILTDSQCQEAHNFGITYLSNQLLSLMVGTVVAVIGVRTMRMLRHEAFEARQLGQYHLRSLIGSGGMGDVYLAEHQMMRRPCAIKLIHPDRAGDPRALARFEREVHSIAKLSHWNSVDIYDYGRTEDGTFYYVMEYLPGMSLQQLVDRHGPLPASRTIHLIRQTCDALAEAHHHGLIHRDIKPANLFAAERGGVFDVIKLLDFGLAKPVLDESSSDLSTDGMITGSPLYMSPEQGLGDSEPDVRSDIYSLGGVAYFLLTGQPPFEEPRPLRAIFAHAHEPVRPPSAVTGDVPEDIEAIVLRCLSKDPAERYQSVDELASALDRCADAGSWSRQDAQTWWRGRNAEKTSDQEIVMAN